MSNIGEITINKIGEAVTSALLDHQPELDKAYQASEEAFSISVPIKIRPCPEGNRVEVGLNFVTSRVKTSVVRIVNEDYAPMFKEGNGEGDNAQ